LSEKDKKPLPNRIVAFLTSLPNAGDSKMHQALIQSAGLDRRLLEQIEYTGPPAHFFQLLMPTLERYGTLEDDRDPLVAILEAAKNYVGEDRQKACEELIRESRDSLL
jgi:hypothetical protein